MKTNCSNSCCNVQGTRSLSHGDMLTRTDFANEEICINLSIRFISDTTSVDYIKACRLAVKLKRLSNN